MRFPILNFSKLFKPKQPPPPPPKPEGEQQFKIRQIAKGYLYVGTIIDRK
jgi:hypothetical protein